MFDTICDLDQKGLSYILGASRNPTKVYDALSQLLAHPLQRPLQNDASYRIGSSVPKTKENLDSGNVPVHGVEWDRMNAGTAIAVELWCCLDLPDLEELAGSSTWSPLFGTTAVLSFLPFLNKTS